MTEPKIGYHHSGPPTPGRGQPTLAVGGTGQGAGVSKSSDGSFREIRSLADAKRFIEELAKQGQLG